MADVAGCLSHGVTEWGRGSVPHRGCVHGRRILHRARTQWETCGPLKDWGKHGLWPRVEGRARGLAGVPAGL